MPLEPTDLKMTPPEMLTTTSSVGQQNSLSEPPTHNLTRYIEALAGVINRIRQPLEVENIFQITATEIRQLLNADRVAVFRFYPDQDWEGEFVSEDVAPDWDSVLHRTVYDHCFGEKFAPHYLQGRVQAVADIYEEGLSDCHIKILGEFQVRANLVVPVCTGKKLWGLLCIHQCGEPRQWDTGEIQFVKQIAEQLGVAVQQAEYIEKTQTQAVQLEQALLKEQTLTQVLRKIRQSLDVQTIFTSTVTEIRHLLNADRVAVFQFYPEQDWEGEFVAEDVAPGWDSVLEQRVYDHCFGDRYSDLYREGQVQAVSDIYEEELSDCHVKILGQFNIRANLVVPVLQGENLWGLLCIHQCCEPRQWTADDISFVQQVATPFGVAIQQAQLLAETTYQAEQQKALNQVIGRIRQSLELETILQTATQEIRRLMKGDRVAVFQFDPSKNWIGKFIAEDSVADLSSIVEAEVYDHCFGDRFAPLYKKGKTSVIADIDKADLERCHAQILERFGVKASIVVPMIQGDDLWGLLCVYQCSGPRQWKQTDIEFVSQIAEQLGVALQQELYIKQVQAQVTQIAELAERDRATERERLLFSTMDRIRQSSELTSIFETATQEVRQMFKAERVAIYQFHADWSGEFIAESVGDAWLPLVGVDMVVADTHLQKTQGGRYSLNETFAVDDIYQVGHAPCHIALLEQFEARAYAIAPIFQGDQLWGLLAAYQNSAPRHWQKDDVDLLAQVANQLGLAIQQAETLAQVKAQAKAIQKSAERQKALARTVEKIRQSLDIEDIFQTTTKEVRQLLDVERVAIYRFNQDWSGDYVADSIVDGWQPTAPSVINSDIYSQADPNGRYPRNETFVPISQGEQLWGLLVAYQTSSPRYWQDDEIQLLAQIGTQLGVALQQAELLKTTKQQTEDISNALQDLQRTQAQLIQGEKMAGLGQLVAGVAHEINNPVNFIYGNVPPAQEHVQDLIRLLELYRQKYPHPDSEICEQENKVDINFLLDDLPQLLDSMQMGASRIRNIVSSLRNFSRMDEADFKTVNIHDGLDSTLLILGHVLNNQNGDVPIQIEKTYSSLPQVECYAGQLNQVFMNILSNAADALRGYRATLPPATAFKPTIWIETEILPQQRIEIRIRDNGPGISEAHQARLFDPFYTTKPVGKGTGLGLSISYQIIVEKHKGQLTCRSQSGKGTEFTIQIPIRQA